MTKKQTNNNNSMRPVEQKKKKSIVKSLTKSVVKHTKSVGGDLSAALQQSDPVIHAHLARMVNPSNRINKIVGLPRFPIQNSFKFEAYVDFDVTTQANGLAFIAMNPTLTNNSTVARCTDGTGAITTVPALNSAAAGVSTVLVSNSPYPTASLVATAGGVQNRLLSAGIEVEYTGTTLNESGVSYSLVSADHEDLTNYAVGNITQQSTCVTQSISRKKKFHMFFYPIQESDGDYTLAQWPYNNSASAIIGAIVLTGVAGTTYHCRLTVSGEAVGGGIQYAATPNGIPKPGDFEHVIAVANKTRDHHAANPHLHPKDLVKFAHGLSHIVKSGKNVAKTAKIFAPFVQAL